MSDFKKDTPNQKTEKTIQGSNKKQPNPDDTTEKHRKPNEEMPQIGDHSKFNPREEAADKTNRNRDKSKRFDKQPNPKKSDKSGI